MPRTFQISEAHTAAFSEQQRQRFEDEMVEYFKREYAGDVKRIGEPGMRSLIQDGIRKAETYKITAEADVARYLQFRVAIAPDFDTTDWAAPLLADERLTPARKLQGVADAWAGNGGGADRGR